MFFILEKKTHDFQSAICGVCMFGRERACASQGSLNGDQDSKPHKWYTPLYIHEISKEFVPIQKKKISVNVCVLQHWNKEVH